MTVERLEIPEFLEIVNGYLAVFKQSINDLSIYPRRNIYSDIVILALLNRAFRNAEAICGLVEQSFYDDAFGLSRTLVEIALNLRYLTNKDIGERTARYVRYFGKDRERLCVLIDKYYGNQDREYSEDHEVLMQLAGDFKTPNSWYEKGNLKEVASEPSTWLTNDDGEAETVEYIYDVPYRLMSHQVHSTCIAVDSDLRRMTVRSNWREPFKLESKQQTKNGTDALFTVWMHLHYAAECAMHGMNLDFPIRLQEAYGNIRKRLGF